METSVKQRIMQFIENKNISIREFERFCGLSNGYMKSLRHAPKSDKLSAILSAYPELSQSWLLTGEGSMLNDNKQEVNVQKRVDESGIYDLSDYETWLLPQTAHGGSLNSIPSDGIFLQNCEKMISPIKGVDFAITVYGDSMAPEYPSGSRILIKKINPDIFIDWGKVYVLDTSNGVIVKEVHTCVKEGYVTCHSINPDPKYADFVVPLSEVYGMYRVLMCLSAK